MSTRCHGPEEERGGVSPDGGCEYLFAEVARCDIRGMVDNVDLVRTHYLGLEVLVTVGLGEIKSVVVSADPRHKGWLLSHSDIPRREIKLEDFQSEIIGSCSS